MRVRMNSNSPKPTMTVDEVADFLQISRSTVYKLVRAAELPGRKVGSKWRFSREVVEAWLLDTHSRHSELSIDSKDWVEKQVVQH